MSARASACLLAASAIAVIGASCTEAREAAEAMGEVSKPISGASCNVACEEASRRSCEDASQMCRRGGIVRLAANAALHCAAAVMAACFKDADGEGRCFKLCRYGADGEGATQEP
jgi:hypothetical protein